MLNIAVDYLFSFRNKADFPLQYLYTQREISVMSYQMILSVLSLIKTKTLKVTYALIVIFLGRQILAIPSVRQTYCVIYLNLTLKAQLTFKVSHFTRHNNPISKYLCYVSEISFSLYK